MAPRLLFTHLNQPFAITATTALTHAWRTQKFSHTRDTTTPKQERIKGLRELIPYIGPLPIVIRLKIFLERIGFPADNWYFLVCCVRVSWRNKSAKACRADEWVRVAMNANQERIKRVYPLLMGNDNRFLRLCSLFEHVSKSACASRNRKRSKVKFVACVAWRFWLGALSNKGGRGQRIREEIGAGATWKTARTDGRLFWVGPHASVRIVPICSECSPVNPIFW